MVLFVNNLFFICLSLRNAEAVSFHFRVSQILHVIIPVEITVYQDRSFSFITKTPPAAILLKKAAKLSKASGEPNINKVATVAWSECLKIAEMKMKDLNASSVESGARMVAGTARSMGIVIDMDK